MGEAWPETDEEGGRARAETGGVALLVSASVTCVGARASTEGLAGRGRGAIVWDSLDGSIVEALRSDMEARLTIPLGISEATGSYRGEGGGFEEALKPDVSLMRGGRASKPPDFFCCALMRDALFWRTGAFKEYSKISFASSAE